MAKLSYNHVNFFNFQTEKMSYKNIFYINNYFNIQIETICLPQDSAFFKVALSVKDRNTEIWKNPATWFQRHLDYVVKNGRFCVLFTGWHARLW